MSRPLWECYIIEGLDNIPDLPSGSFAVYTKMHHSLVDGAGGAAFMAALHDLEPDPPETTEGADQPLLVDRAPSNAELLGRAAANQMRNSVNMTRGALELTRDVSKFAMKLMRKEIPMPDVQAPRTRFNGPVGPYRIFEATKFPLADFKAVKDATGVKLNDVALAVVGGAMARYLEDKGETPEGSLAAGLPVNLRTRRGETDDNNQVGSIFSALHTDVRDPVERLKAIHVSTSEAKEFGESSPMLDTIKAAGVLPPAVTKVAASLWSQRHLSRYLPFHVSTVITNVPGPNFDLYCAGARLVQYQGLGLLTPGVALFHTVFTQSDTVNMSVLGDRDVMPDPDFYMQCLNASWDELWQATAKLRTNAARKAPAKKKPAASKKPAVKKKASAKKAPASRKKAPAASKKTPAAKKKAPAAKKKAPAAKKPAAKTKAPAAKKQAAEKKPAPRAVTSTPPTRLRARRKNGPAVPRPKLQVVSG